MLEAVPWENPTYGISGGAAGNVAYGGTVNPLRNRKGGAGNPPPTGARASALPDTYNPLSARMAQDPYPFYARLRERDPVHRSRVINAWLFTRYADVDAVLRDHRHFGNDPRKANLSRRQAAMLPAPDEYTLLSLDAPDHTRLRALVTKVFTRTAVDGLEARIRGIMGSLLDDIDDPGAFDLIEAVAQPLPVIVIAEMIGVPPEDRAQFKIWSAQRARLLEPMISARERKLGDVASRELNAYFRSIIEKRRAVAGGAARRYRQRSGAGGGWGRSAE